MNGEQCDLLQAAQPLGASAVQEMCISVGSSAASSMASSGLGSFASPNPNQQNSASSNRKSRLPPRPPPSANASTATLGGSAGPAGHVRLRSGRGSLNQSGAATATATVALVARSPSPAIARAEENGVVGGGEQQAGGAPNRLLRQQHSLSESESSQQQPVTVQTGAAVAFAVGEEAPLGTSGSSAGSSNSPGSNSFLRQPRQRSASPFPGPDLAEHSQNAGSSHSRALHNGQLAGADAGAGAADAHAQCSCGLGSGALAPAVELRQRSSAAAAEAFKARSISMIAFDNSCASLNSLGSGVSVSVSQRRVREISDPMLELLGVAQRLVRLTQEPALEHSTRRVLLQRYDYIRFIRKLINILYCIFFLRFYTHTPVHTSCILCSLNFSSLKF